MSEPRFKRVLLLGHTGYIGSRLQRALQAAYPSISVCGRSIRELDLTQNTADSALEPLVDSDTVVVICAAVKKQLGDNPQVFEQNFAIALNLCKGLGSRPAGRIVFISSAAVYGEDVEHDLITEKTAVQPTSYYGIAKFTSERLLVLAAAKTGAELLVLRPAQVYGPAEPDYYYGPSGFLRKALAREPITLWGDGEELREFLFIDDVVALINKLIFSQMCGVLNVVSGTSYTYRRALDEIAALTGGALAINSKPRTKDKVDHRFDATALRAAVPGFEFTPLARSLHSIADSQRPEGATA